MAMHLRKRSKAIIPKVKYGSGSVHARNWVAYTDRRMNAQRQRIGQVMLDAAIYSAVETLRDGAEL